MAIEIAIQAAGNTFNYLK